MVIFVVVVVVFLNAALSSFQSLYNNTKETGNGITPFQGTRDKEGFSHLFRDFNCFGVFFLLKCDFVLTSGSP